MTRVLAALGVVFVVGGALSGCGVIGVGERSHAPLQLGVYGPASVYTRQTSLGGDPAQDYLYDTNQQPYGEPPNSYRAYPGIALVEPRPPVPVRQRPAPQP